MSKKMLKLYFKLGNFKNSCKNRAANVFNNNKGEITVEQILWIIIVVVIVCGIIYGFISGWFSDLLNSMKSTTDAKLDPVIN